MKRLCAMLTAMAIFLTCLISSGPLTAKAGTFSDTMDDFQNAFTRAAEVVLETIFENKDNRNGFTAAMLVHDYFDMYRDFTRQGTAALQYDIGDFDFMDDMFMDQEKSWRTIEEWFDEKWNDLLEEKISSSEYIDEMQRMYETQKKVRDKEK